MTTAATAPNRPTGTPPPILTPPNLERKAKQLEELCGHMLATLKVNRLRMTITTADDAQFDAMLDSWAQRFKEI